MKNVLLLYNQFIPSVQFCAYLHLHYLQKQDKISFQHCKSIFVTEKQLQSSDIIIFVRSDGYLEKILSEKLHKGGKYLIYVLDDDLLNVPKHISASKHYTRKDTQHYILSIMNECDCLLSPSIKILNKYSYLFKSVGLIEQPAEVIEKCQKNDTIRIGFAGSIDRTSDIKKILPEVVNYFYIKYGNLIEFNFIGIEPFLSNDYNIKYFPFEDDYDVYRNRMIELNWDIGLAPLEDTEFNNFKHYNKYIEYSSLGIAGVYSKVTPYKEIISHNITGLLSDNTALSWIVNIERYIKDNWFRDKIVYRSQEYSRENFSIEITSKNFMKYLDQSEVKASKAEPIHINFIKFIYILIKIKNNLFSKL